MEALGELTRRVVAVPKRLTCEFCKRKVGVAYEIVATYPPKLVCAWCKEYVVEARKERK